MPKIAVGTVYRNLAALCDAGLLRKITMPNGPDRYDKNVAPHEHILCSSCGRMFDLSVGTDEIAKLFKDEPFKITGFTLTVVGTCKNCLLRSRAPGA
jgi:Fur family peroxide stress response transcriptional regulator